MCSVIGIMDEKRAFLGANYDFRFGHGLAYLCTRGLHKWAEDSQGERVEWTNRYGSVSFVQFGCELPTSGMNEAGLAIHLLEQRDAEYPVLREGVPRFNELQWIQYQLDNYATIEEVVHGLNDIQIEQVVMKLHYSLCDASGQIAIVEFVNGQIVVERSPASRCIVMTNHSQATSEAHYHSVATATDNRNSDSSSLNRYVRLRKKSLEHNTLVDTRDFIWDALQTVAIKPAPLDYIGRWLRLKPWFISYWQCVFDPTARQIHFEIRGNRQRCFLDLTALDFSTSSQRMTADLHTSCVGDFGRKLISYSRDLNTRVVQKTYAPYQRYVGPEAVAFLARYPETFSAA